MRGSGGSYGFFDARERRDLYEAIERVASENPPHLACIAPYEGHLDLYRGWATAASPASS